ncbi:MAG: hypothetical protein H7174_05820 [Flavobacterium sp.]|nr:hypothetical protein [Flavobacterium sp.]
MNNYKDSQISILIDENCHSKEYKFNKLIDFVDARFSNFKVNPYQSAEISENKNLKFLKNISEIKNCDWIIFENKDFDYSKYKNIAANGILSFKLTKNRIKETVLKNQKSKLKIEFLDKKTNDWLLFLQELDPEKGLKNNISKVLLNYNIYLLQFLRNYPEVPISELLNTLKAKKYYAETLIYYFDLVRRLINRKFENRRLNWKIALKQNNEHTFIKQPENSFWADPFIINENNTNYLFFEELKPDRIGAISFVELDDNFDIVNKKMIINQEFHLSFPNVFKIDNSFYMIPESSANNSLDLYKCYNFPDDWRHEKILMANISLIDPVILFHNNLYWIFANKIEEFEHDNNERLYLYYSDDLFSEKWHTHQQNPVVNDASLARNAGKIFLKDNKLFRVSQNCSKSYGQNLVVNKITTLSTTNYKEQKSYEIFAENKFKGMHTMNFESDIQVFDFLE